MNIPTRSVVNHGLCMLLAAAFSTQALALDDKSARRIGNHLQQLRLTSQDVEELAPFTEFEALYATPISGWGFSVFSILKFKIHKDNPGQIPVNISKLLEMLYLLHGHDSMTEQEMDEYLRKFGKVPDGFFPTLKSALSEGYAAGMTAN